MKYNIGLNLQMEQYKPHHVRYVQCGIVIDDKFTGHIADYLGSGERTDFYFLNGMPVLYLDVTGTRSSISIYQIEDIYPHLFKEIFDLETKYFYYEDHKYVASDHLKTLLIIHPKNKLFHCGVDLTPITVGNTLFGDVKDELGAETDTVYKEGICHKCKKKIHIPEELYSPKPEEQHCFGCMEDLF